MQRQELSNSMVTTPDIEVTREVVTVARETVDNESYCHESQDERSKTENIQGTDEIETSNDEASEEAVNEYNRMLEVQKKNEEMIALAEKELEEQNELMDEFYEEYDSFQTGYSHLTGEYVDTIRTNKNHKDEVKRLRIEHYSQIISVNMLHTENEEMKEQIDDLLEEILQLKELQKIGADRLRAEMERMKYYRKELAMQSEISKCELQLMRSELNSNKMEMLDRGITYTTKKMMVTTGNDSERGQHTPPAAVFVEIPSGVPRLQLDTNEVRDITAPLLIDTPRIGYLADEIKTKLKKGDYANDHSDTDELIGSEQKGITKCLMDDKTKIPEPEFHPYGSAKRDISRFRASGGYLERKEYIRDEFVPNGQKHVAKCSSEYKLTMDEFLGNTRSEFNRSKGNRERSVDGRRSKKAVKSKIDTGLRIRHANTQKKKSPRKEYVQRKHVRDLSKEVDEVKGNTSKTNYGTPRKKNVKAKINTGLKGEKRESTEKVEAKRKNESKVRLGSKANQTKGPLPALKSPPRFINQDKGDFTIAATTRSFTPTNPLPPIPGKDSRTGSPHVRLKPLSPIKAQNRDNNSSPDKVKSFTTSTPLPQIGQKLDNISTRVKEEIKNANLHDTLYDTFKQDIVGSCVAKAEALWFSFSPSPPPGGASKKKIRGRKPKLTSDKLGT